MEEKGTFQDYHILETCNIYEYYLPELCSLLFLAYKVVDDLTCKLTGKKKNHSTGRLIDNKTVGSYQQLFANTFNRELNGFVPA